MLAFWRQADRFDPARRLSTWLLGMARHKAISAMRTAKPKPTPVPVAEADPLSPEMVLYSHEHARTVVQAIATLPPEQRLVIEMTYYQDCSPQDIAARTGVLVNTVRSRLRLAHRRLA